MDCTAITADYRWYVCVWVSVYCCYEVVLVAAGALADMRVEFVAISTKW